ncbi:MAG: nucleoid-associated protein [Bacteroidota bacterium]
MLNFSDTTIDKIIVHQVGNPSRDEQLTCSRNSLSLNDSGLEEVLSKFFLSSFHKKELEFYNFHHDSDLDLNEMFHYAGKMFTAGESFELQSVNIAKHLFDKSSHPKVKSGELYIVLFNDCMVDDELMQGLGIFKSENKDVFLKVFPRNDNNLGVEYQNGVNINKLDKGCIIFNTEKEHGYKICLVDKTNGEESQYWKDLFLKVVPRDDDFYQTRVTMNMCRSFCNNVLIEDNDVSKNKQLQVKEKIVQYFSDNESFVADNFEQEVLQEPEVIDAYREYRQKFAEQHELVTPDSFDIAPPAVKKEKKFFKSVIKLDKNFHVYVHGNPNMIEKGFDDERGKFYYKLFFDEET